MKANHSPKHQKGHVVSGFLFRSLRIAFLIVVVCALNVNAKGYTQERISLNLKEVKVSQLFKVIQQRTSYQFLYNNEDIERVPLISISVKNATVPQILDQYFRDYPLAYNIKGNTVIISYRPIQRQTANMVAVAEPQLQVSVTGKVTNEMGDGLAGVSVTLKSSPSTGTTTDENGNYSLSLENRTGTLVFSYVGYNTREVRIDGRAVVDVTMHTTTFSMDEVVITGTSEGTTRRQLGSYVGTVKASEIEQATTGNVLSALQGKTPGAQIIQNSGDPGGSVSVRLRGTSTINSSSDPLYIVDGVIVSNTSRNVTNLGASAFIASPNRLIDINPSDIDRIEILNGAAAAAIYGSRANAGVVQIFTKRGSSGAPQLSLTTSVSINQLRKSPGYSKAPVKFGPAPDGPGAITQDILLTNLTTTTPVTRYNYWDYIFRDGLGTDNNLSVSGGKDDTKYYASASYFKNQGIVRNTDFQRFSFRMNLDQKLASWVSLSAGINYTNSAANEKPSFGFNSPINGVNIIGNFHDIWKRDANGNLQAVGERGRVNPVSIIEDYRQRNETNRIISSVNLKVKPIKDVTIDYVLGMDNVSQIGTTYIPPYTYNASPSYYGGGISMDPTLNGYAGVGNNQEFLINNEINATYNKNITDDFNSTTQLGYSLQYQKSNYTVSQGRGLAPFVKTVSGASTNLPGVDERLELSINGVYLQQNFKFKNRYFITAAGRLDGSSVFGENERNQFYTKLSGSYIISDEAFWESAGLKRVWDFAKLRAAYGESGNLTGIGAYDRFNVYNSSPLVGHTALMSSSTLANESMKPEKQRELEVGTDMSFMKERIRLTFNWYDKRVTDLLLPRFIAPTNGFTSLLGNIGSIRNKGIEIMVGGSPVRSQDFEWDINLIYNKNKNSVEKIPQGLIQFTNGAGASSLIPGYPVGVFYGFFFARDESGNIIKDSRGIPVQERGIQDGVATYTTKRDGNGMPTGTALRKVVGDPNPDWTGTLTNNFRFRRLSLFVQFDAVQGLEIWNADFRTRQGVGNGVEYAEKEHMGLIPRGYISGVYNVEEWRMDDGSFVKLREVSLSYDIGKVASVFNNLSLSLSGRNLISWDNYRGFDPEPNSGGTSTIARGYDSGNVPIPRTFAFTVNAKF